jgi:hypothetical protein
MLLTQPLKEKRAFDVPIPLLSDLGWTQRSDFDPPIDEN